MLINCIIDTESVAARGTAQHGTENSRVITAAKYSAVQRSRTLIIMQIM